MPESRGVVLTLLGRHFDQVNVLACWGDTCAWLQSAHPELWTAIRAAEAQASALAVDYLKGRVQLDAVDASLAEALESWSVGAQEYARHAAPGTPPCRECGRVDGVVRLEVEGDAMLCWQCWSGARGAL